MRLSLQLRAADHFACVNRNSEVQFAGAFGEHGVHHTLTVCSSLQIQRVQCARHLLSH